MIIHGDCLDALKELPENSVDSLVTDPPYGIAFMGKSWDEFNEVVNPQGSFESEKNFKKLPRNSSAAMIEFFTPIWKECLRVMKPGAFGFVMCIPRQDCLSRMMVSLEDAGFKINFTSIYWTYASGFPKPLNIGKAIDKRNINNPNLDGSYGGFQPKPAVEVIIVVMKPLSAGSYIDQALENGKGVTWSDDCRIPYKGNDTSTDGHRTKTFGKDSESVIGGEGSPDYQANVNGRFPANLLVSDDVLEDGRNDKPGKTRFDNGKVDYSDKGYLFGTMGDGNLNAPVQIGDSGGFSRFFSLDAWAEKNLPFLIVSKASKSEKNKGLDKNIHPTVKPIKLMSYLITLGSRPGDVILDPFGGSGTTACAAITLDRKFITIEKEIEYIEIIKSRVEYYDTVQRSKPLTV